MGKGDKKSKRGKVFSGSFGKHRLKKKHKAFVPVPKAQEKVKKEETTEEVKAETKKVGKKKPGRKKTVKKESE